MAAPPDPAVTRIPHGDFIGRYWAVAPGEHISLIGPTGTGKTTLGMKLIPGFLAQNPQCRAVVLAMKPHRKGRGKITGDETVARYARAQKAKIIRTWPARKLWPRHRLFVLWPRHNFDRMDDARHADIFADALADCYREGDWLIFGDETYSLTHEMKLDPEMIRIWSKGRSMGTLFLGATQRPAHVPLWFYSQAAHVFLWHDPDAEARKRYAQIGGFDPRHVERVLAGLGRYDCLYLRRQDRVMCILES